MFLRNNYIRTRFAFTLAEVLITLLIIGVVSSLVIPALIQETQDAELKVALKKSISILSQANTRILSDNAGSIKGVCTGGYSNSICLKNLFVPYLSVNKSCAISTSEGCWHKANNWFNLNPNTGCGLYAGVVENCPGKGNYAPGFILNDGSFITFFLRDGACGDTYQTNFKYCGYSILDVNGFKKPNTIGKDIFAVWIRENRISPLGSDDLHQGYCGTDVGTAYYQAGWGCTAQYLKE